MPYQRTDYAVAIILETPDGFPLISDPHKPLPLYWKFPGGRSQPGEIPLLTAIRELREETGVDAPLDEMKLLHEETRVSGDKSHEFFVFYVRMPRAVTLLERGSEGEVVRNFTREELKTLPDFFPAHRALMERFVWNPRG